MWVTIIALILITIMFEFGAEAIEEHAGEELKEVVDAMMKELTILGFIGLSSFLAQQAGLALQISIWIFQALPPTAASTVCALGRVSIIIRIRIRARTAERNLGHASRTRRARSSSRSWKGCT